VRFRSLIAALACASALATARLTFAYGGAALSDAAIDAQCRPYFHDACSMAIGRWLPELGYSSEGWDDATHVSARDGFIDGAERPWIGPDLGYAGPKGGTFFVYGAAGPPKGHVIYDSMHRIAFFAQGCCSWKDVVAAADVPAPPQPVARRNLAGLATVRGIRLGQTPSDVRGVYGPAKTLPTKTPGISVLAYTRWPKRTVTAVHMPCGQFENFYFKAGRLVLIQLGNGC